MADLISKANKLSEDFKKAARALGRAVLKECVRTGGECRDLSDLDISTLPANM